DRYRIERELGAGGMATVYLAEDLKHDRKVALKVLKPELAAVVGAERFLAEIKTTAKLQHPHILPLYDSGEADSFLYYVMPYVQGETLRDRIDREKQLPVGDAVDIAVAVAQALQHAHERGVIHRDIKPANILVQDGQPVVSDFGIALAVGSAGGARLTETGLSVGTPYYMSPEQATGDQGVGPSTDIYALAAVLYEMLVGDPPYTGSTAQAVLGKIIQGSPTAATDIRKAVPTNVDHALRKGLEKLPADRFAQAQDFARALEDPSFRYGAAAAAGTAAGPGLWRPLAVGFGVSTLAFGALAFMGRGPDTPPPVQRFAIDIPVIPVGPAVLPDGSGVAITTLPEGDAPPQLVIRRWGDLEAVPVPSGSDAFSPEISPDGTEVAFFQDGELKVSPLQGGVVRTLTDSAACCARWGTDGFIYYSPVGPRTIRRIPEQGGPVEDVTQRDQPADGAHGDFQLLPGGRAGVFTVWGQDNFDRIEALKLDTGERTVVTPGINPYYVDSGHLVFASLEGEILAAPFDVDALELTGPAVPVVEGVFVNASSYPLYSVSPEGTLVYMQGPVAVASQWEFVWVTREGSISAVSPGESFGLSGGNRGWRLSPDGSRVAFMRTDEGNTDIWTKELPDGPMSRLTFEPTREILPQWSPDGTRVLYSQYDPAADPMRPTLWSRPADGTGSAELLFDGFDVAKGIWSPDGESLVIRRAGLDAAGAQPARDIYVRPAEGGEPVPLIASETFWEQGPALSRDGRWLAYVSNETGRQEIFVRPFPNVDDGKWQITTEGGVSPLWAHNGEELFFYEPRARQLKVAEFTTTSTGFRRGRVRTLFDIPQPVYVSGQGNHDFFDVTPDDERFLMVRVFGLEDEDRRLVLVQNFDEELKRVVPR
ncbi:MAG: protein kinase, partial [Longimicrobiales bacterium]|nr:protein kinase [Longimicrobiales bacterium]